VNLREPARTARLTWASLGVLLGACAVLLAVPAWRSPAMVVASALGVLLVLAGIALHRPAGGSWPLVALMVALWGSGAVLVQVRGEITGVAVATVWAGQLVAAALVVLVARGRAATPVEAAGARLDGLVIATVLLLVGAQLVVVGLSGHGDLASAVVASLDVTLLGMLLRFAVSSRLLQPGARLSFAAAFLTIGYDLTSALQGRRLALPGEPTQVLGVAFMALYGLAALHPTMRETFSAATFARRRPPSAALLGLLPLVLVPVALSWSARVSGVQGLPGWTLLAAGTLVAGLCLLRAAAALRGSEHLAAHDPLTDLANRRGLAAAYLQAAGPQSLMLIDVDEFKQVNDTHGHDTGDALLLMVRDRLLRAAGRTGLVARLGGDEFVVLAPTPEIAGIAQRLLDLLQTPFLVEDLTFGVSASLGTADADVDTPLAELLTHADVAMYAAKAAGGGGVVRFHPDMRSAVARRYTLSGELRRLLGSEAPGVGRLEVHYQPLVELATGEVVGAEALVRWRHPERGLLAPDAFLALVSSNGLDAQLDSAVLREVVDQLARWRDQGRRALPVSVNLTLDSLHDPDLTARVLAALERGGVPPQQLHLEITEHQQLPALSPADGSLADLRLAGVDVHLDDYGTGYTSLDYLQRFPVQVLKLDRSVVASVGETDAHVVAGVCAMAGALGIRVLAEGVETAEQRDALVALGVRYGQGYLFARPLPAAEYAETVLGRAAPADATPVAVAPC
jgi:diguanylate cyclase (GGDEF)-like protein